LLLPLEPLDPLDPLDPVELPDDPELLLLLLPLLVLVLVLVPELPPLLDGNRADPSNVEASGPLAWELVESLAPQATRLIVTAASAAQ
jgi:hypothetical protein